MRGRLGQPASIIVIITITVSSLHDIVNYFLEYYADNLKCALDVERSTDASHFFTGIFLMLFMLIMLLIFAEVPLRLLSAPFVQRA